VVSQKKGIILYTPPTLLITESALYINRSPFLVNKINNKHRWEGNRLFSHMTIEHLLPRWFQNFGEGLSGKHSAAWHEHWRNKDKVYKWSKSLCTIGEPGTRKTGFWGYGV